MIPRSLKLVAAGVLALAVTGCVVAPYPGHHRDDGRHFRGGDAYDGDWQWSGWRHHRRHHHH